MHPLKCGDIYIYSTCKHQRNTMHSYRNNFINPHNFFTMAYGSVAQTFGQLMFKHYLVKKEEN